MKYPLFYPNIHKKDILKEINETLSTRWLGEGPKVKIFEEKFGEFLGCKYPIAVNSCTSALHLSYLLAGAKKGTEIIAPVFTCSATIHAILYTGAIPIFADIKDDFTIDPKDVAKKITKKTVAIVAVDYSGKRCDYNELKKFGLPIVADKAQSLQYDKDADYNCFGFQAIKLMTTCDGGMLVTKTKPDYDKGKRLRWFGIDRKKSFKEKNTREVASNVKEIGYKYQMTDIDACFGLAALKHIKKDLKYRQKLVDTYNRLLVGVKGIEIVENKGSDNWLYTILVDNRSEFFDLMNKNQVEVSMAHARIDDVEVFKKYKNDCPNMDALESRYVCLPLNPKITIRDVVQICKIIKSA